MKTTQDESADSIGVASSISGVRGGDIFIYSYSQTVKQSISNKINNAEHEYMNMSPPPTYRAGYATGRHSVSNILLNIYYETAQAESTDSVSLCIKHIFAKDLR